MKPKIFVGSSVEKLDVARAIQANLEYDCYSEIWSQGTFELSKSNLENLIDSLESFDFAIFVLYPEDVLQTRNSKINVVRDNVIFELGLFFGKLGRNCVYFVVPRGKASTHLPTDLLGITYGTFDSEHTNLRASLEPFCTQVREKIKQEFLPQFPEKGLIGLNVLHKTINQLTSDLQYNLCANTPNNFDLKVTFQNLSFDQSGFNNTWLMPVFNNDGWVVDTFNQETKSQVFQLKSKRNGEMVILFNGKGKAKLEFYKNGEDSPFNSKEIEWQ
ncbi:MAG: hypothetical protein C0397_19360 [Odoribacter sp.]|nr:hypothetical protein [Odoribacter sp.]